MRNPDDALGLRNYQAMIDLDHAPDGEDGAQRYWFRVSWPEKRTPTEKHFLALIRDQAFRFSNLNPKRCCKC